ncbi:MAG: glycosyltransferase family 4 protein [Nitrospira sp.]|nr:glycosyltransferase family 4 protein [Nitrospira sp.]
MRIAFVISLLQMGGMETVLKSLGTFFHQRGVNIEFIEVVAKGRWSSYFQELGFPVKTLPLKWYRSKIDHSKAIGKVLTQYDVVFLNDVPYAQAAIGVLQSHVIAIPIIHLDLPSFISNAAGNAGQWDKVVAVSLLLKEKFLNNTGFDSKTTEYIANGVAVPKDWPKKDFAFNAERPLNIVFSGRIENRQKGTNLLPDIVKAVNDAGARIHLNIIGDGPDLRRLQETFNNYGITNINFYGALKHHDALKVLSENDMFIMPSFFEGMPISLLESMAQGLVPIVSNLKGSTDLIVRNELNGCLVQPGDKKGFISAICSLSKNRLKLKEMSMSAWEGVRNDFSVERMGTAYLQLIDKINCEKKLSSNMSLRSGAIDLSLLGDYPRIPGCIVRPVRKILKVLRATIRTVSG